MGHVVTSFRLISELEELVKNEELAELMDLTELDIQVDNNESTVSEHTSS